MKDTILAQISELTQDDKSRLYKIIEGFLFNNELDITKEQNREKVAVPNNCPHCESTKTGKMVINMVFNVLIVTIVKRIFE
jgi:hypothetical protein